MVQQASNPLQSAAALLNAGRLGEAEAALDGILRAMPGQPDALHLRGAVASKQGQAAAAERWFRAALDAAPNHPPFLNSLANLLAKQNRAPEAEALYRQAIQAHPAYGEAYFNLGLLLSRAGDARVAEARAALERAADIAPANPAPRLALAGLLKRSAPEEAIAVCDRILAQVPGHPQALYHKADAASLMGSDDEAVEIFRALCTAQPAFREAWVALGHGLSRRGRAAEAIEAYRRAVALDPGDADTHYYLNREIFSAGAEGYLDSYREAIARLPDRADLPVHLASHLMLRDRVAEARAALEHALSRHPDDPFLNNALAIALVHQGEADAAMPHHEKALAAAPHVPDCLLGAAQTALVRGEPAEATPLIERVLTSSPADQKALAHKATAQRLARGHARDLYDYDRFVGVERIDVPPGFPDLASFNAALARDLEALHTASEHPFDQTLRHGTQTGGHLFDRDIPTVAALRGALEAAILRYVERLPDDPEHPFLNRKSRDFRFAGAWSVRLRTSGYHTAHIHPAGWLSSAYYVSLPPEMDGTAAGAGWLHLGQPGMPHLEAEGPEYIVRPEPGLLALFPSYMWHGTRPFESQSPRLTVAFDVVPAAEIARRGDKRGRFIKTA